MPNRLKELPNEITAELLLFFKQSKHNPVLNSYLKRRWTTSGKDVGDLCTLIDLASNGQFTEQNKTLTLKILRLITPDPALKQSTTETLAQNKPKRPPNKGI